MSIFSLVMLVTALLFLYFVIRGINKNKILFDQAAMWLVLGILMVICALFPSIPTNFQLCPVFSGYFTDGFALFPNHSDFKAKRGY